MTIHLTEDFITEKLRTSYRAGMISPVDDFSGLNDGARLKCAAVLIPLAWWQDEWQIVLTRRTETVEHHKGQVSFPGGGCATNETSPEDTAMREAGEEIGLEPADIRILGLMNEVITTTQYRITPVVGIMPWPYLVRLEPAEVVRVFTIPLLWLAKRQNWEERPFALDGAASPFPVVTYHIYDGEILWGASARIMLNFIGVLGLINN
jgi:8-oxo-dGTP pyrophosphatase MutT (NUDIX family)